MEVVCWFEAVDSSTRITLEYGLWPDPTPIGDAGGRMAWYASKLLPLVLKSTGPQSFGDWWTDRVARKPSGPDARRTYADPLFHRPNFLLILDRLHLDASDRLLEVGCGGGAFLKMALASGCRAVAVDHSHEMVELTRELNREAVADHRLEVLEADATRLPFPDESCSCAVTTGSFGFWERPVEGLMEVFRVLQPGGRLILFNGTKELRGTPAAPEPIASRVHWYEDTELEQMARQAGFASVKVDRPALGSYARAAGLPAEAVAFFEGARSGAQVLEARKAENRRRAVSPARPARRRRKP